MKAAEGEHIVAREDAWPVPDGEHQGGNLSLIEVKYNRPLYCNSTPSKGKISRVSDLLRLIALSLLLLRLGLLRLHDLMLQLLLALLALLLALLIPNEEHSILVLLELISLISGWLGVDPGLGARPTTIHVVIVSPSINRLDPEALMKGVDTSILAVGLQSLFFVTAAVLDRFEFAHRGIIYTDHSSADDQQMETSQGQDTNTISGSYGFRSRQNRSGRNRVDRGSLS